MTKIQSCICLVATLGVLTAASAPIARSQAPAPTFPGVDEALGRKGAIQPCGVLQFSFPRSDLTVVASDVTLKPFSAHGDAATIAQTLRTGQPRSSFARWCKNRCLLQAFVRRSSAIDGVRSRAVPSRGVPWRRAPPRTL